MLTIAHDDATDTYTVTSPGLPPIAGLNHRQVALVSHWMEQTQDSPASDDSVSDYLGAVRDAAERRRPQSDC